MCVVSKSLLAARGFSVFFLHSPMPAIMRMLRERHVGLVVSQPQRLLRVGVVEATKRRSDKYRIYT